MAVLTSQAFPIIIPFTDGKFTVKYHHFITECFHETHNNLIGQHNFRNQHNGYTIFGQTIFGYLHIDLCLTATRNPMKQKCLRHVIINSFPNWFITDCLFFGQRQIFNLISIKLCLGLAVAFFHRYTFIGHNLFDYR